MTKPKAAQSPFSILLPLNRMRRTAPASRPPTAATRSGYARALTPTPTSTRPADREAPKQAKTNAAVVLTGPAPSGMTCSFATALCWRGGSSGILNGDFVFREGANPLRRFSCASIAALSLSAGLTSAAVTIISGSNVSDPRGDTGTESSGDSWPKSIPTRSCAKAMLKFLRRRMPAAFASSDVAYGPPDSINSRALLMGGFAIER